MTLRRLCPTLFVLGIVLMIPFEEWYTRLFGVLALVGFVVSGLFLIASPEYLARDPQQPDEPS
mgnify:CR=1 FL=1